LIFNSINAKGYLISGGSIACLKMNIQDAFVVVQDVFKTNHYEYYFPILIVSLLAFYPILQKLKLLFANKLSWLLFSISIAGTLLLMAVAIDWGRFIYIHLISIFLLSLTVEEENIMAPKTDKISVFVIIFAMVFSLGWYIPDCCFPKSAFATKLNQINITHISKTLRKVVTLLDK